MNAVLLAALSFAVQPSEFSHLNLPVHGTIHKKNLYGFFGKSNDDFGLDAIQIDDPPKTRVNFYWLHWGQGHPAFNFRHHIKYDSIWISTGYSSLSRLKFQDLSLYDSKNANEYFRKYPNQENSTPHQIVLKSLYERYRKSFFETEGAGGGSDRARNILAFGTVPIADTCCKCFIFSKPNRDIELWEVNFCWDDKAKRWKTQPALRYQKIGKWVADLSSASFRERANAIEELEKLGSLAEPALKELLKSKVSLEARRGAEFLLNQIVGENSKAEAVWEDADGYEKLPSLFADDFHFFVRKNNYYFVTQSGKLYIAPPAKAGEKTRTMKVLWNGLTRPITAIIEDADRDKVWLFAEAKDRKGKGVYFEMQETIRTESFDPTKLRPVNVEGRAKRLLEYLPLISVGDKK